MYNKATDMYILVTLFQCISLLVSFHRYNHIFTIIFMSDSFHVNFHIIISLCLTTPGNTWGEGITQAVLIELLSPQRLCSYFTL